MADIAVYNRTCVFQGDVVVPLFETPFFVAGATRSAVVPNSRFTAFYSGDTTLGVAPNGFIYRPNVTTLNVTPNLLTLSNASGGVDFGGMCVAGQYAGGFMTNFPASPDTGRDSQLVPFGVNSNNPLLSQGIVSTDPNFRVDMSNFGCEMNVTTAPLVIAGATGEGGFTYTKVYGFWPHSPTVAFTQVAVTYSGVGEAGQSVNFTNCCPNYDDDNNYFLGNIGNSGSHPNFNIVRWGNLPRADFTGTRYIINFDDAGLNAQLTVPGSGNVPPKSTRVFRKGFILMNLAQVAANQAYDVILISYDGSKWWRIKFSAQTPRGSVAINNGGLTGNYAFHIDFNGIAYLCDYTDNGRLYTSFGLNIPLQRPILPTLQVPGIPCFAPCYPLFLSSPSV